MASERPDDVAVDEVLEHFQLNFVQLFALSKD